MIWWGNTSFHQWLNLREKILRAQLGDLEVETEDLEAMKEEDQKIEQKVQLLERVQNKLGNPGFVDKAPEAVIGKEKEKAAGFERDIAKLNDQIEKIKAL